MLSHRKVKSEACYICNLIYAVPKEIPVIFYIETN